jgi:hypothetical protein
VPSKLQNYSSNSLIYIFCVTANVAQHKSGSLCQEKIISVKEGNVVRKYQVLQL